MNPGEAIVTLMVIAIGAATFLTGLSLVIKHRQHMAGVNGKGGDLRNTVAMLTEALERQHDKQQTILRRLGALEADPDTPRLTIGEEAEAPEPVVERRRVRA